jgi:5-methyltetrahydrofolate--homocysteine methyltransferase
LAGKVVLGTVKDDLHDIGKNLVGMMLEGAGFEVIDLGIDTPPQRFVEAVRRERPALVAISALLTTTMQGIVDTIEALTQAGMRDKVQIMVGGAPVTQAFASQIGADGYASDAASAADLARSLIESRRVMPGRAV